jgi:hypothetical protein
MTLNPKTYVDPSDVAGAIRDMSSAANGITAFAGGGQASATPMTRAINRVTTVATAGDSVKLPLAKAGASIAVINSTNTSMNVFPQTGEAINDVAANGAYAIAANKAVMFLCAVNGTWDTILTA